MLVYKRANPAVNLNEIIIRQSLPFFFSLMKNEIPPSFLYCTCSFCLKSQCLFFSIKTKQYWTINFVEIRIEEGGGVERWKQDKYKRGKVCNEIEFCCVRPQPPSYVSSPNYELRSFVQIVMCKLLDFRLRLVFGVDPNKLHFSLFSDFCW
jgi:hypothetical protein